jgi:2-polyprenyl-3-methyl-5-hydroxy-6-metoxy-1,4-benzoquinol methylase
MDYRSRCYESFISKHWAYSHKLNKDTFDFMALKYKKQFLPFLPKDKKAKIVDIACGAGHFLYFMQKEGYEQASGLDISKEQVAMAQKIGIKNVQVNDLFSFLPKYPDEFDMIVANDIIEHLNKNEIIQFLDAIHKAIKPGGSLLLCTINAFSLFGAGVVCVDFTHEVGFTPISLAQVLRVCRFTDVEVYGEKPVAHDLRSNVRQILWRACSILLSSFLYIERGHGRVTKPQKIILEPRMFAVAKKS